ncbi:hypothetical protein ACL9RL_10935 [Plantibacter sp. Mn2098]|uniref:hypothetical protein n=1 Tax=Plantibacter sp. Mn2098 TaxID=3395266 RepID=UPI003BE24AAE
MTSRAVLSHPLRLVVTLAIVMLLALGAIGQRCATLPAASATVPAASATLASQATTTTTTTVPVDVQLSPPGCGVPDDTPTNGRDITLAGHGWATAAAPDGASPVLTATTSPSPVLAAFGHEPLTLTIIALCISRT